MSRVSKALIIFTIFFSFFFPRSFSFAASLSAANDAFLLPGETLQTLMAISNPQPIESRVFLTLHPVSFAEGSDAPIIGEEVAQDSWISLLEKDLILSPFASSSVKIKIAPPESLRTGSYVFALVSSEQFSGEINLVHGNAALLFVTVGYPIGQKECQGFEKKEDGKFLLTLTNAGEGILYEEGRVTLRGLFGFLFASGEANPDRHRVFSHQTRSWETESFSLPWWTIGPVMASFETNELAVSCPVVHYGFRGGLPLFCLIVIGGTGFWIARRFRA